jgi:hypothetical protein
MGGMMPWLRGFMGVVGGFKGGDSELIILILFLILLPELEREFRLMGVERD